MHGCCSYVNRSRHTLEATPMPCLYVCMHVCTYHVEDSVHHAGHGDGRTAADRYQEWIVVAVVGTSKLPIHIQFQPSNGAVDVVPDGLVQVPAAAGTCCGCCCSCSCFVLLAERRSECKSGRHVNAHVGHFLQAQALAAEHVPIGVRHERGRTAKGHNEFLRRRQ